MNSKIGIFASNSNTFWEAALVGELDAHLDEPERQKENQRNGNVHTVVQACMDPSMLEARRDCNSGF